MKSRRRRFRSRGEWRAWLEKNHGTVDELWLVYFKKHTRKRTVTYDEAVEEALCFGWIDGKVQRLDEQRYMQRFTPRKPKSIWSETNRQRVKKMIVSTFCCWVLAAKDMTDQNSPIQLSLPASAHPQTKSACCRSRAT